MLEQRSNGRADFGMNDESVPQDQREKTFEASKSGPQFPRMSRR